MKTTSIPPSTGVALLRDFSLEMTGKDTSKLGEARQSIPPGTRINVTYLGNEDLALRLDAATTARDLGFVPVPHISARRLASEAALREFLTALRAHGVQEQVFAVGGDPAQAHGPYDDSLQIIRSRLLQEHGVRRVGISGYPEGHPQIPDVTLWAALTDKAAAMTEGDLDGDIITQFGFDADPVLAWIEEVRARGIHLPVRVGVPGPAGVKRLLAFATRFGVGTSTSIARKYGLSLTNLMGTAGPDRFLRALAAGYDVARHGDVKLHFYTFGGLGATSTWIDTFRDKEGLK
ncbi:methylenetetrahydrofolate reductase [Streptomyces mangrovisoli]|uniref:Methylenetetrahydrofolate reductase n=1 Tax=Streptomyces mangrovisoli TaxID=1428628 RepID=A0A1J4P120_9ACTN|nr:methylenetetrahydrofolate reductase [Streptomyces mangrovisoli]OIJ68299.1 5,10-methylenetetrahydrofolate reductase [Streptomyces mangrovisoli]